ILAFCMTSGFGSSGCEVKEAGSGKACVGLSAAVQQVATATAQKSRKIFKAVKCAETRANGTVFMQNTCQKRTAPKSQSSDFLRMPWALDGFEAEDVVREEVCLPHKRRPADLHVVLRRIWSTLCDELCPS